MVHRRPTLRKIAAIAGLLSCLPGPLRGDAPKRAVEAWPVALAQPIAVNVGRCRFVVPSGSPSARTLVIVSALADKAGRYPVRITARAASSPEVPQLADDGPMRLPSFAPTAPTVEPAPSSTPPRPERTFHLPVRDGDPSSPSNYVSVRARLRASSARVQVYVDPADLARVDEVTIRDAVATFDDHVFPVARDRIGVAPDVDGDGRFAILFSGWLGHLADGKLAVDGFVRGADLEPGQIPPLGNRADVMYLNAGLKSGPHLRTVMAHEYTHAVTYGRKALGPARRDEEGWLDEATAHLAEDLHGFSRSNLEHRVAAFLDEPERFRLIVEDFGAADTIRSHGHRGASYLFLRWCARECGPNLLGRMVRSDLTGVANLEAQTGRSLASLVRGWTTDLVLDAIAPGSPSEVPAPNLVRLLPGGDSLYARLDASATLFAIVEGSREPGIAIAVDASPEAGLQVTAIPLPEDYPRVDLAASIESDGEGDHLRVRIRERDGHPVAIFSVEWFAADGHRLGGVEGGSLAQALGRDRIAGSDYLTSAPLPITERPARVLLVGIDAAGRKVFARGSLGP